MLLARRFGRLRRAGVRSFVVLRRLVVRRALELLEPFAVRLDRVLRMLLVHDVRVPAAAVRRARRSHAVCESVRAGANTGTLDGKGGMPMATRSKKSGGRKKSTGRK